MTYLLDTHVVLWLAGDAERVPEQIRRDLQDAESRLISAATAMEVALKSRLGKLPRGRDVIDGWSRITDEFLATELPLTVPHMTRAGELDWSHRDPFDRMLVAQAMLDGLTLVTTDRRIVAYDDVTTLSW